MHELQSDGPTSPYANMSIPFFDRGESNALGEIASREYRSLSETVSTDGLVARLRENDKAALHKLKGGKPVQADSQPKKCVALPWSTRRSPFARLTHFSFRSRRT